MVICCFCEEWGEGGIESFLLNLFEHLDIAQIEVDIVTARKKSELYMPRIKALGINLIELSGSPRSLFRNHSAFRKLLRKKQYDILYLNIYHALSLLYARDAKQLGIKVRIAHSHNNGLRRSVTKPIKLIIHMMSRSLLAKHATECWACSDKAAGFIFPKNCGYQYIPNGIETIRFAFNPDAREKLREGIGIADNFVIGNVGRLCYQKNQEFLLDVIYELRKTRPEAKLLLVGDGSDRTKLKKKARKLGIEDAVIFYGATSDVTSLLWAMDVFSFPSRFEGLGIAVVEAQAAGLPVVCSDRVPPEAGTSRFVEFLPLSAGAKAWAKRLLTVSGLERRSAAEMVSSAGYDITEVARTIQNAWIKAVGTNAVGERTYEIENSDTI